MKISVLNIGNELLKGSTANTNLASIGQELLKLGVPPIIQMTVNDDPNDMKEAIAYLEKRSDVIISTGGLGPTTDDITVEIFADYFGLKLYTDEKVIEHIHNIMGKDKILSVHNKKQAIVPVGSTILENRNGTAPGISFEANGKLIFLLPGPPSELIPLFKENVLTSIRSRLKEKVYFESLYTVGIAESELQRIVSENIKENQKLYIAYRAEPGGCELTFSSPMEILVSEAITKIRSVLGLSILDYGCKNIAEEIIKLLAERKMTLSLAESCTGGMIASKIVDVPGSSKVFKGSVTAYLNEIKMHLLKVKENTLLKYGAVSEECAKEMAEGCANLFNTDIALSATGIAGPDGGTSSKPVGTVFISVTFHNRTLTKKFLIKGDRSRIRIRSTAFALNLLRNVLLEIS
ncbi:MAG TPA: competence/damage-inducible protein A [Lentisphaeria bacterium]|nr:MAG: hypothetical protein A2X47_07285 [Lentisphaerae bacterium GWF2_38_69]HBM15566.1 competence/damage-inducible protein A [Lentisphaeria bacterium]